MTGFKDIIGNELIKEQLSDAIEHGRLSHAYLLSGDEGMGKKKFAESLCLELFCDSPDEHGACLSCPSCKKVLSGNHPDVIWLKSDKPDLIKVDEIREQIVDTAQIKPFLGKFKVYIIPDCERMNQQAQNALLKILEEPPEYMLILLLCGDETAMLETILSRVVRIKLKPRTDAMVKDHLRKLFPEAEDSRIDLAVAFSRGNPGKAEKLLSGEEFSEWYIETVSICRNIKKMDSGRIAMEAAKLTSSYDDLSGILELMQLWYRDLMMFKVTKDIGGLLYRDERKAMMELAPICSYEGVEAIMEAIETCRIRLKANVNPELAMELLLLKMKEN
ncbi:MAG TPA: DNA polymerase III subunit delta [Candidatus Avilachnospira avistercoris]|nr:DNA polymerase III subunit delta [Candidatus Avilachnospira avistercoris]